MDTAFEDTVLKIFCKVLGVSESKVNNKTAYNSLEAWDSLKHLEMVSKFEEEFDLDIDMDDVIAMENFGKVKEILWKNIEAKKKK